MIRNVIIFIKPIFLDLPPNSLRDPNVGPKVKKWKNKRVGARSLTCSTSGIGGHVGAPGWD
jgi:hypothetical protein